MTDEEERELRIAVMQSDLLSKQADVTLKTKQAFWETPRNIVLIVTAAAGIAGVLGFKLGQREPPAAPTIIFQPGSIQVLPAPSK